MSDALGRGKAADEALSSAMPQLVDRMALVLPCREQCEATVDSCSCADHELTFGELLEQALTARGRVPAPHHPLHTHTHTRDTTHVYCLIFSQLADIPSAISVADATAS